MYSVWVERNLRVFKGKSSNYLVIKDRILQLVKLRVASFPQVEHKIESGELAQTSGIPGLL